MLTRRVELYFSRVSRVRDCSRVAKLQSLLSQTNIGVVVNWSDVSLGTTWSLLWGNLRLSLSIGWWRWVSFFTWWRSHRLKPHWELYSFISSIFFCKLVFYIFAWHTTTTALCSSWMIYIYIYINIAYRLITRVNTTSGCADILKRSFVFYNVLDFFFVEFYIFEFFQQVFWESYSANA